MRTTKMSLVVILVCGFLLPLASVAAETSGPSRQMALEPVGVETGERALAPLARGLARALGSDAFRQRLFQELSASPYVEGRVPLKRLLDRDPVLRDELLWHAGIDRAWEEVAVALPELELYFPTPEHRTGWTGDAAVRVAVPAGTAGRYLGFAPDGGRTSFAGASPPEAPTLLLAESEIDFDDLPSAIEGGERTGAYLLRKDLAHRRGGRIEAPSDPLPGSGLGTKTSGVDTSRHTYLTGFKIWEDYDGWGSMEIEVYGSVDGSYSGCQRFTGIDEDVIYYLPAPGSAGSRKIAYAVPTGTNEVDILVYEDDDTGCVLKGGDDYIGDSSPYIGYYGAFVSYNGWAHVQVETEDTACGDTVCEGDESTFNCCADCTSCGDGTCQSQCGENGSTCSTDCYNCGNSVCESWKGEDIWNCSQDCGTCGNGWCDASEDELSCPLDCCSGQEICPE